MERGPSQRGNAAVVFHDWPDEVLLTEYVRTHDERLFSEIIARHERMVVSVCRCVTHRRQDTEDAAQQTWLVLLRKSAFICNGASLKSWLHGVAHREARNVKKSRTRRKKREMTYDLAQLAQSGDEIEFQEEQALVDAEVQSLPEKCRVCFMLCCLEGKSKREVAKELGLKQGTVASRVRTVRKIMRQSLERRGIAPSSK